MLQIKNKISFYLKNIGIFIMLPIGILLLPIQVYYPPILPYNTIWLCVSLLFQIVGWNEPTYFLAERPI